jgi:hypothetical protein
MVNVRKRIPKRRSPLKKITKEQLEHLIQGWVMFGPEFPFRSEEHRRRTWEICREGILEEYRPGLRPRAWWQYEAPEPRRLFSGTSVSVDPDSGEMFEFTPSLSTVPDRRFWSWYGRPQLLGSQDQPIWETQLAYLERLNLARPGERQAALEGAIEEWISRHEHHDSPPPMPEEDELLKWWDEI